MTVIFFIKFEIQLPTCLLVFVFVGVNWPLDKHSVGPLENCKGLRATFEWDQENSF